jgi:hypothetical protein
MDFFLDIFNQLFTVNDEEIFIIFDIDGNIWFKFKDVLKVLGYSNLNDVIFNNKFDKRYKLKFNEIKLYRSISIPINFQQNSLFINEIGLYKLLLKSTKDIAKTFLDKYLTEIMPEIRKTGKYISNKSDMQKIKKLNKTIDNYKAELNYYYDKFKFEPSEFGYLYICENNHIQEGIEISCFKIGYALDMRKRIKEYQVGNFKHKLLAYIPLQIDRKQIENCVKIRLKPHLTKLITDSICYISLSELKKDIIECINFTTQHIIHCFKCSKIYNLNSLNRHKCYFKKVPNIIDYIIPNIEKASKKSTSKKSNSKKSSSKKSNSKKLTSKKSTSKKSTSKKST